MARTHSKDCLAAALISAVENWRDNPDVTPAEFASEAADFRSDALEYLDSGLQTCICAEFRRVGS